MFLLRLTSDPRLHGVKTDDGFRIGELTGDTGFLLIVASALGAAGGMFYLIVRQWLPQRIRPAVMAVLAGLVGGAVVIRPGGLDFTLLAPKWLAILMFVLLPACYGAVMALLVERLLSAAESSRFLGWAWALIPLVAVLALGPPGFVVLVISALGWALNRESGFAGWWTSPGMARLGQVALVAGASFAAVVLFQDIAAIL